MIMNDKKIKVCVFMGSFKLIKKSGVGKAIEHQIAVLKNAGFSVNEVPLRNCDIVHINFILPDSVFKALHARKLGVKVIFYGHSTMEDFKDSFAGSNFFAPFFKRWIKFCYNLGDIIITPSEYSKKILEGYGLKKEIYALSNGIDTDLFAYNESTGSSIRKQYGIESDSLLIGHSGTISKLKNQELLIRLLPEIQKKKKAELLILGTCPNQEEVQRLKNLASEPKVSDSVHFAGAVMNVNEHLSAFDVFAFPSLREGTPLALIEAQANGLPCVISDNIAADAVLSDLVTQIPLSDEKAWINALSKAKRNQPEKYVDDIKKSGYDAREAYRKLFEIYRS